MIDLFEEDTDGSALKYKTVMGRRNWTCVDYLPASGELRYDVRVEIVQGGGDTKGCVFFDPSLLLSGARGLTLLCFGQVRAHEPAALVGLILVPSTSSPSHLIATSQCPRGPNAAFLSCLLRACPCLPVPALPLPRLALPCPSAASPAYPVSINPAACNNLLL